MCGIAGFSGQFDRELLVRMNATLAHRGPDDAGIWFQDTQGIGLAQQRLAIIDLSPLSYQPIRDITDTDERIYF